MAKIEVESPEEVAKEAFWIAYKHANPASGMGMLSAHPNASKSDVINNVRSAGDYPGGALRRDEGEMYGDYVFGRKLKLKLRVEPGAIVVPDSSPQPSYQSWSGRYPSYETLIIDAADRLSKALL